MNTVALLVAIAIIGCSRTMQEPYAPNTLLDSASENQRDVTKLRAIVTINNEQIHRLEESAIQSNLFTEKFLIFYGGVALMNLMIFGLSQGSKSTA